MSRRECCVPRRGVGEREREPGREIRGDKGTFVVTAQTRWTRASRRPLYRDAASSSLTIHVVLSSFTRTVEKRRRPSSPASPPPTLLVLFLLRCSLPGVLSLREIHFSIVRPVYCVCYTRLRARWSRACVRVPSATTRVRHRPLRHIDDRVVLKVAPATPSNNVQVNIHISVNFHSKDNIDFAINIRLFYEPPS